MFKKCLKGRETLWVKETAEWGDWEAADCIAGNERVTALYPSTDVKISKSLPRTGNIFTFIRERSLWQHSEVWHVLGELKLLNWHVFRHFFLFLKKMTAWASAWWPHTLMRSENGCQSPNFELKLFKKYKIKVCEHFIVWTESEG